MSKTMMNTIQKQEFEFLSSISSISQEAIISGTDCISIHGQYISISFWHQLSSSDIRSLSLLLCRCIAFPNINISKSSVGCLSILASKENDESLSNQLFSHQLNALLSNAIVKRLEGIISSNQIDGSGLSLLGACLNCLIDLHSSDNLAILDNYEKLKISITMKNALNLCYDVLTQKRTIQQQKQLHLEDQDDYDSYTESLQEILENVNNFLEYKEKFTKSLKNNL
jgi:hypothetical protein